MCVSRKDLEIIDILQEILEENQPKIGIHSLTLKALKKIKGTKWGLRYKIKFCLFILYFKRQICMKHCISAYQTHWRTWIWLPKNNKKIHLRYKYGADRRNAAKNRALNDEFEGGIQEEEI